MTTMMNPVLPVQGAELKVERSKVSDSGGDKFSDHLDRKIEEKRASNDKLGVKGRQEKETTTTSESKTAASEGPEEAQPLDSESSLASILGAYMQQLQEVSEEKTLAPGEWSLEMPDGEFLTEFAAKAGMTEAELGVLSEQFIMDNGEVDLPSFFQVLADHFQEFTETSPVVVPETELPFVQVLLEKMGLGKEDVTAILDMGVVNDGELDLGLLGEAMAELDIDPASLKPIILSDYEVEDLQNLLAKAGLPLGKQLEILPEQVFGKEFKLGFERLQNILQDTVSFVQNEQPKVDLQGFLGDLEVMLKQAGFEGSGPGFSPVIQESVSGAYHGLMAIHDESLKNQNPLNRQTGKVDVPQKAGIASELVTIYRRSFMLKVLI